MDDCVDGRHRPPTFPGSSRVRSEMPPVGEKQLYWGVATDFSEHRPTLPRPQNRSLRIPARVDGQAFRVGTPRGVHPRRASCLGLVGHSVRVSQLVRRRTVPSSRRSTPQKATRGQGPRRGERLQRLERIGVVGQLSTIFAHEMRQPLGAISLWLRPPEDGAGRGEDGRNAIPRHRPSRQHPRRAREARPPDGPRPTRS